MSKELEALKRMEYFVNEKMGIKTFKQSGWHIEGTDDYEIVKQALLKTQELEKENNNYKRVLKIINEKGFDKSIKDYDDYDIWLEYKIEKFDNSIKSNPTVLNWNVFNLFTYNKEEFDLLKAYVKEVLK